MIAQIDNENKAYLLGLYYSDGYLRSDGKDRKRYGSGIKIKLSDKSLLIAICDYFEEFVYSETESSCVINTYKKSIRDELISNGLVQKKSSDNKLKLRMPLMTHELMRHFIRGVFDGDGSITYTPKNGARYASFVMNNYFFITKLREYLLNCGIRCSLKKITPKPSPIRGVMIFWKSSIYQITINANKNILAFADLIYPNNTKLFMKRKLDKFVELRKTTFNKKFRCPRCNSLNTTKHGLGRIMCKNCRETSRVTAAVYESNLVDYDWMNSRKAKAISYANLELSPQRGKVQRLPESQQ